MIPALGTLSSLGPDGRLGVVIDAQPVGREKDGQQLVSVRIREIDGHADGKQTGPTGATRMAGLAPDRVSPDGRPGTRFRPSTTLSDTALSPAEKEEVARLRQRDAQVQQEENAHAGSAGDLAGPIQYTYVTGPDGRRYAVGGAVSIRAVSPTGDPAELRHLGARIAAAAHAAHNPSAQDLAAARSGVSLYARAAKAEQPKPSLDLWT